jgi:5-methylcytosine-specific restriction endonuclease McrA
LFLVFLQEKAMQTCILLNSDYTLLHIVSWQRAVTLIVKEKVQVIKYSEKIVRSASGVIVKVPLVMRLIKLIRTLFRARVPFSKKNILTRDGHRCAYCGNDKERLTIDHILPLSRNGGNSFENCVTSCRPCNNKKGNRTPSESGMYLRTQPFQPTISEFLRLKANRYGINDLLKEL